MIKLKRRLRPKLSLRLILRTKRIRQLLRRPTKRQLRPKLWPIKPLEYLLPANPKLSPSPREMPCLFTSS